jgi:hypothetical protein
MTEKILLITLSMMLCLNLTGQDLKNYQSKRDTIVEYFDDGKIKVCLTRRYLQTDYKA